MREQVIAMLTALGVTGAAEDPLLDIVISNVQYRVQNETNRKDMPEGLVSVAVYMAGWRIPEHEEGFRAVGRV